MKRAEENDGHVQEHACGLPALKPLAFGGNSSRDYPATSRVYVVLNQHRDCAAITQHSTDRTTNLVNVLAVGQLIVLKTHFSKNEEWKIYLRRLDHENRHSRSPCCWGRAPRSQRAVQVTSSHRCGQLVSTVSSACGLINYVWDRVIRGEHFRRFLQNYLSGE